MASKKEQTAAVEATVTQLTLVNFDEIENIETEETTPAPAEQSSEPAPVETEEQVLATVETFDSAFVNDPCKQDYLDFATEVKSGVDTTDMAVKFVGYGLRASNIMVKVRNIAPNAYDRAAVMKRFETALRVCNVPESMVKPQEIVALYWLVQLVRSTPGAEGRKREDVPWRCTQAPDWFGGQHHAFSRRSVSSPSASIACPRRTKPMCGSSRPVTKPMYASGFSDLREGFLSSGRSKR